MKKQLIGIGGTLIISFFLVACGTNTKSSKQSKSVEKISIVGVKDKYIYSNNPVVISGKTNKNAKVKLIEVDDTVKTINSNKNGAFKFTITQPDEYKITVSKNSKSKSVKTSVENNPSIQSSISESMKNASSMADTSSDESVSETSSTTAINTDLTKMLSSWNGKGFSNYVDHMEYTDDGVLNIYMNDSFTALDNTDSTQKYPIARDAQKAGLAEISGDSDWSIKKANKGVKTTIYHDDQIIGHSTGSINGQFKWQ